MKRLIAGIAIVLVLCISVSHTSFADWGVGLKSISLFPMVEVSAGWESARLSVGFGVSRVLVFTLEGEWYPFTVVESYDDSPQVQLGAGLELFQFIIPTIMGSSRVHFNINNLSLYGKLDVGIFFLPSIRVGLGVLF